MTEPFSVVAALVSHLCSLGFSASTRVPADAPGEFFTVERVGGGVSTMVDHSSVALQAWAETDERACSLAEEARLALLTVSPPAGIFSTRVESGPYQFFDPTTRRPRYQIVLSVTSQVAI